MPETQKSHPEMATSLLGLSLLTDNVFPRSAEGSPKVPSTQYDPAAINISSTSGDFNCVVQLSAWPCLNVFDLDMGNHLLTISISPSDLKAFFDKQTTPFDSSYLNELKARDPTKPTYFGGIEIPPSPLGLVLSFSPTGIDLSNPNGFSITYTSHVVIGELQLAPGVGNPRVPARGEELLAAMAVERPLGPPAVQGNALARRLSAATASRAAFSESGALGTSIPSGLGAQSPSLGFLTITITGTWYREVRPSAAQVDVFANMDLASTVVSSDDGDAERFLEAGLFGPDGSTIQNVFRKKSRVHIIPRLELRGADGASQFEAEVFIAEFLNMQAITCAFNLKVDCSGVVEEGSHFIGNRDCGVIMDHFLVTLLFRRQWSKGGFARHLPLNQTIKIKVNGQPQDATLHGDLELLTLEDISIIADANTRGTFFGSSRPCPCHSRSRDIARRHGIALGTERS